MKLRKFVPAAVYVVIGIMILTITASAQNGDIQDYFIPRGAIGFTQNQKNLDVASTTGLISKVFTEANSREVINAVLAGTAQIDPTTGLLSGTGISPSLIDAWNTQMRISNVIFGDWTQNPSLAQQSVAYQQFLNQLSPGLYTTLPTILFNSANIQNTQIQQRLWAVRAGATKDTDQSPIADGGKTCNSQKDHDKKVVVPMAEDAKKWDTFVDGNGMWSQAQTVNNLPSYNSYAGGVQIGATHEIFRGLNVGPYVGYQGTKVNYTGANGGNSSATDNSVRFGLLGEFQKGGWYTDGIIGGAYNSVAVNHGINISGNGHNFSSMANGNVAGGELDSLLGTGYEFKIGKFVFGPSTSLQYTYLHLGGTTETGAGLLNQTIGAQNANSLLYTLGGQASYTFDITQSLKLQPFLSLAWQHEFLQNGYNLTSSILGQSYNYQTANPGRDQYIAGIGGNLVLNKSLSAYAICNLINGDQKIFSQAVSGGINVQF